MAEARLARCPRCKAHTLVDNASGIALAVDIAPVDALGYGVAIASGIRLWWVEVGQKRPSRVVGVLSGSRMPSWDSRGAQASIQKLHAEHSCGAPHRDQVILPITTPKGSAPATPGAPEAGSHPHAAPVAGAPAPASPSPATTATRRPTSRRLRCSVCDQIIAQGKEPYSAIECGEYAWACHEECP